MPKVHQGKKKKIIKYPPPERIYKEVNQDWKDPFNILSKKPCIIKANKSTIILELEKNNTLKIEDKCKTN